ncbi:copper transporter [Armillaria fumosa]|nr:copper transporter [Armillaria fumosa]
MDSEWQDYLHWSFKGSHVLFSGIYLDSFVKFLVGSVLTVVVCLTERLVTFASNNGWCPAWAGNIRWRHAFWKALLYGIATLLRLAYMLIAMSFHVGLILVTVITLSIAQFFIEYHDTPKHLSHEKESYSLVEEPLLYNDTHVSSMPTHSRPRSKSKPNHIFIHPNQSNLARADAAAFEMGIGGNTERMRGNMYTQEAAAWEMGKGREGARALMGQPRTRGEPQRQSSFRVGSPSDSESDTS